MVSMAQDNRAMIEQEMQIIEIASDMRYVLLLNQPMPMETIEKFRRTLRDWQQNDEQFLILQNVTLRRADE